MLYRRRRYDVARTVSYGKRPSDLSQSYRRGGIAAAAATALYCRRRCSVERTVSHDNYDYRCTAAETAGYALRSSSPRARLVGIARTRFPKPGRRNGAPVAVAAGKTNAAVEDDCRVAHKFPSSWLFCFLKKTNLPCARCFRSRRPCPLQYINRSSSPIRFLSLLRSSCSPLLTARFPFSDVPEELTSLLPRKRYRGSGVRASDHTLTLLF